MLFVWADCAELPDGGVLDALWQWAQWIPVPGDELGTATCCDASYRVARVRPVNLLKWDRAFARAIAQAGAGDRQRQKAKSDGIDWDDL